MRVDNFGLSLAESVGFYTSLNGELLCIIDELPHFSEEKELSTLAAAYYNFLQGKERTGIERAVLGVGFASKKLSPELHRKFSRLVLEQNTYGSVFESLASEEQVAFYRETVKGPVVDDALRMREIAFTNDSAQMASVDPGYWFKKQTTKVSLLKDVESFLSEGLVETTTELKTAARSSLITVIVLNAVLVSIAIFLAVRIARMIAEAIRAALEVVSRVAKGDLTQQIHIESTDEIGQLCPEVQRMNDQLLVTVTSVKDGASSISLSAGQIAAGNMSLSQRTEQQASALGETTSIMEEVTDSVKQNAEASTEAKLVATDARDLAERGGNIVSNAVAAMSEISKSSKKVSEIINVIDEVAFQTNLLSLNAAVEAARAGEHGRGFSVVASAVGTLAQRSADYAKEIKELISDSSEKVRVGSDLVKKSGEALNEIVVSVKKVSDLISEIAAMSAEQASGISQVKDAISDLDRVAQQNAALVEEATAAIQSLDGDTSQVADAMSFFTTKNEQTDRRWSTPVERKPVAKTPPPTKRSAVRSTVATAATAASAVAIDQALDAALPDMEAGSTSEGKKSNYQSLPRPIENASPSSLEVVSDAANADPYDEEWEEF